MYKELLKRNILFDKLTKSIGLGTMFNFKANTFSLNEQTLQDLIDTMNNNYRAIATYKEPIRINNLKEYYYAGTKLLKFYCNSKSNSNNDYSTNIIFGNVDFVQQDPQSNEYREYTIVDKNGQTMQVWYKIPILGQNPAKVNCTCPDFRWRFTMKNKDSGYLNGSVPNFVKNYKKRTNRPSQQGVGICRHLFGFVEYLKKNNYLR